MTYAPRAVGRLYAEQWRCWWLGDASGEECWSADCLLTRYLCFRSGLSGSITCCLITAAPPSASLCRPTISHVSRESLATIEPTGALGAVGWCPFGLRST